MTFAHQVRRYAVAPFVGPHSVHGYYGELMDNSATATNAAWPAANRAMYYPLILPEPCTAYRFFWVNGTTVGTHNFQMGLYNDNDAGDDGPGTSIVLGNQTLSAGASACQFDDITDTPLPAGRLWIALWGSGTTPSLFRHAPSSTLARHMCGMGQASLTGGLPATATPVSVGTLTTYIAVCGFTTIPSP